MFQEGLERKKTLPKIQDFPVDFPGVAKQHKGEMYCFLDHIDLGT